MTDLATHMALPAVGEGVDSFQNMLMPMGMPHQDSAYNYAGSEYPSQSSSSLRRFAADFEDPLSHVFGAFDATLRNDAPNPDTPSIEHDDKLLCFSLPAHNFPLLSSDYRPATILLSAQLHGTFFLAESPWPSVPGELTCYRRNLFHVTGKIALPTSLRYIVTEQGEHVEILRQELVISATESIEGNSVKIISVPWKTAAHSSGLTYEDKLEHGPPSIPLDWMHAQHTESGLATFPFQWKRLHFRSATANNGRRKELQQHFVVRLKLLASLANGRKISLCEVHSGGIVVRGRSPRNFESRKDRPLNEQGRRNDANGPGSAIPDSSAKSNTHDAQQDPQFLMDPNASQFNNALFDWCTVNNVSQSPSIVPLSPSTSPFEATDANAHIQPQSHSIDQTYSPSTTRDHRPPPPYNRQTLAETHQDPPTGTESLSLIESTPSILTNPSPTSVPTIPLPNSHRLSHITPPSIRKFSMSATVGSPEECADLQYEYFPIGLNDWLPPVDSVYRPHAVHHLKSLTDPRDATNEGRSGAVSERSGRGVSKNKRFFTADVD